MSLFKGIMRRWWPLVILLIGVTFIGFGLVSGWWPRMVEGPPAARDVPRIGDDPG